MTYYIFFVHSTYILLYVDNLLMVEATPEITRTNIK